jgi:competence protein ComEC
VLLRGEARLRLLLVWALAFGLGAARFAAARPPLDDPHFIASYNEAGGVILDGLVSAEPDQGEADVALRIEAESVLPPGAAAPIAVHGLVLVSTPGYSASRLAATADSRFHYGDRLRIYGPLKTPAVFEGFSYADYLARSDVYAEIRQASVSFVAAHSGSPAWQALYDFKAHALSVLARLFPEPHAALLSGILLGDASGIPLDVRAAFAATSTSHIIAISGQNSTIW